METGSRRDLFTCTSRSELRFRRMLRVITSQEEERTARAEERQKDADRQRRAEPGQQRRDQAAAAAAHIPAAFRRNLKAERTGRALTLIVDRGHEGRDVEANGQRTQRVGGDGDRGVAERRGAQYRNRGDRTKREPNRARAVTRIDQPPEREAAYRADERRDRAR